MSRRGEVRLRWALVDGERVEAMRFVDVPPDERPVGHCPCCNERIRWQAGNRWREHNGPTPHVAHLGGAACSTVTSSESEDHLNAKLDLADALAALSQLEAARVCQCQSSSRRVDVVAQGWTRVAMEHRSPRTTRVPDVALLNEAGAILLAIEVVHTHAVDAAKAADYVAAQIPWIEVSVEEVATWLLCPTSAIQARAHGNLFCGACQRKERGRPDWRQLSLFGGPRDATA